MPLSPEYSFTQTAAAVSLHVALKGTPKRKVDIYIADVFVKINFAPYLLQLDLCAAVSLERCVARFDQRDGKLHVVLEKAAPAAIPPADGGRRPKRAAKKRVLDDGPPADDAFYDPKDDPDLKSDHQLKVEERAARKKLREKQQLAEMTKEHAAWLDDRVRRSRALTKRFRVGALVVHDLGDVAPHGYRGFHTVDRIYPLGYRATRIFWSFSRVPGLVARSFLCVRLCCQGSRWTNESHSHAHLGRHGQLAANFAAHVAQVSGRQSDQAGSG